MRELGRIICHIPARAGSKRVKSKNLRLLCGKPMIAYSIETAKKCNCFDDIYVNTDSEVLIALAESLGVKAYKRGAWLASDEAKGDDFTADFLENVNSDTLIMISPVCPLISHDVVKNALDAYAASSCDTLITCNETQMQVFSKGKGVNIDDNAPLAPTQNNPKVQILNWAVTIWESSFFLHLYHSEKKGYLGKNRILFPISPIQSVKISHEEDFQMAERLIKSMQVYNRQETPAQYWTVSNSSDQDE